MTTKDVFEKYKHMDHLLSDRRWLGESLLNQIAYDFWQAIKASNPGPLSAGCDRAALGTEVAHGS